MADPFTRRSVLVEGFTGLKEPQVVRFSGREVVSRPFEYEVILYANRARASSGAVEASKLLGHSATVTIAVAGPRPSARHINGVIAEFAHVDYNEDYHEYRAVLRPAFWLLSRRADCRIFNKKSTPEIVAEVCNQSSVALRLNLDRSKYEKWDFRVQYHESDFDFLSRLLEHDGIYYYFEHKKNEHTLVLVDDVAKLDNAPAYSEVPYAPPARQTVQRDRDSLCSWSIHESFQAAASATTDYNFEKPSDQMDQSTHVAKRSDGGRYEMFEYPAGANPLNRKGVEHLTKVRAERFQAAQSFARGEGDAAGITAGHVFKMTHHPRPDLNRRWFVISSAIEVSANADDADDPYVSVRVEAVDASLPYRPERVTPKPTIHGTQTAVVVAADKKVDKYGRVRVRFHWDRAAKDSAQHISVRVAQSWAGKGWGAQFLPRVGQEVVVSFLDGDPDRPIVIGSVYNEEHLPPFTLPDQAHRSGWRSASNTGSKEDFNELRFDDEGGKEQIYLHAQKDLQVVVENDQTVTVGTSKKGNRTTTIEGNDQLTVKGDSQATVNGNRQATVKGTDTIEVTKSLRLVSREDITIECGAAKIVLKKNGNIEINGIDVKVSGSKGVTIDGTKTEVSGTSLDIKGTKTAVQGSATLDLTASGVASLKGSLTKIG